MTGGSIPTIASALVINNFGPTAWAVDLGDFMGPRRTVTITMFHPDDGTENYEREMEIFVRCTPGDTGHTTPRYGCAGCPPEPPEFEVIGGIYIDDKMPITDEVLERLDAQAIEQQASEIASDDDRI
jgi:hypothetical protein